MATLSLSVIEIIVLMLGAITLGITIHFFIVSRKSLRETTSDVTGKINKELEMWKLKYFNDTEVRDKELEILKKKLADADENSDIYSIEAEELRIVNKKLQAEIESYRKAAPPLATTSSEKPDYIEQLRMAQTSLLQHNEKINQLLGQIDIVKETEERQQEIIKTNEELSSQIDDLRFKLSQKEKEINNVRQKEHLTTEMNAMLDSAYSEFNVLQDKIQKLEHQVNVSKRINLEYEELKEVQHKMTRDFEEQKLKYQAAVEENRQLQLAIAEAEDSLKETEFQRHQLQKRVAYLEELNNDMQAMSDANKKLEGQLKRIGELESMLNVIAEERDQLIQRKTNL
ncbi:MAG TPA: hypothetical protein PLO70_10280 [Chitinophagaceae bacterium]|mgnify:FL=1|nr:hypothetical protein [Chitinophagaceae bacterium]HQZ74898.1 hypothetical protein [Chitinophagaceae bacterium]